MTLTKLIASILVGWRRSFLADAKALVADLDPPLRVIGQLPDLNRSSWLIAVNHNHGPDFNTWWMPLTLTTVMRREIHWIMTSKWRAVARYGMPWLTRLVAFLLRGAARCYGFTSMPPMPPLKIEAEARASAVRKVLKYVDSTPNAILGLAPEGRDSHRDELITPSPGVGRFVCQLAKRGMHLLPTGVFEDEGSLCLRIGDPMPLPDLQGTTGERDKQMSDTIMHAIAQCLPVETRGPYS
jgi:hypothetical protein